MLSNIILWGCLLYFIKDSAGLVAFINNSDDTSLIQIFQYLNWEDDYTVFMLASSEMSSSSAYYLASVYATDRLQNTLEQIPPIFSRRLLPFWKALCNPALIYTRLPNLDGIIDTQPPCSSVTLHERFPRTIGSRWDGEISVDTAKTFFEAIQKRPLEMECLNWVRGFLDNLPVQLDLPFLLGLGYRMPLNAIGYYLRTYDVPDLLSITRDDWSLQVKITLSGSFDSLSTTNSNLHPAAQWTLQLRQSFDLKNGEFPTYSLEDSDFSKELTSKMRAEDLTDPLFGYRLDVALVEIQESIVLFGIAAKYPGIGIGQINWD